MRPLFHEENLYSQFDLYIKSLISTKNIFMEHMMENIRFAWISYIIFSSYIGDLVYKNIAPIGIYFAVHDCFFNIVVSSSASSNQACVDGCQKVYRLDATLSRTPFLTILTAYRIWVKIFSHPNLTHISTNVS